MKFWLEQNLIAIDQLLNTLVCMGWADETMSSVAWRMEQQGNHKHGVLRKFIDLLFWFQKDHCRKAYESERLRLHLPPEAR